METCKHCKYWYSTNKKIGHCDRIDIEENDPKVKEDDALISIFMDDNSGLTINLTTGCDFGCTKFVSYT